MTETGLSGLEHGIGKGGGCAEGQQEHIYQVKARGLWASTRIKTTSQFAYLVVLPPSYLLYASSYSSSSSHSSFQSSSSSHSSPSPPSPRPPLVREGHGRDEHLLPIRVQMEGDVPKGKTGEG